MNKYPFVVEWLLYFRQRISLFGFSTFLFFNLFEILKALKISFFMMIYNQMNPLKQEEVYPDLFSLQNFEILTHIFGSAAFTIFICGMLIWFLDSVGIRGALKTPEFRRLERSVRQEMKRLEVIAQCSQALGVIKT